MKSTVERGCELARSGNFSSTRDVESRLRIERYDTHTLFQGASFKRQLRSLIQASQLKDVTTAAVALPEVAQKVGESTT